MEGRTGVAIGEGVTGAGVNKLGPGAVEMTLAIGTLELDPRGLRMMFILILRQARKSFTALLFGSELFRAFFICLSRLRIVLKRNIIMQYALINNVPSGIIAI